MDVLAILSNERGPHLEPVNNVDVAFGIEFNLIARADPSARVEMSVTSDAVIIENSHPSSRKVSAVLSAPCVMVVQCER